MSKWTKIAAYTLTPHERERFQRAESQRAYNEYLSQALFARPRQ